MEWRWKRWSGGRWGQRWLEVGGEGEGWSYHDTGLVWVWMGTHLERPLSGLSLQQRHSKNMKKPLNFFSHFS